MYRLRCWSQFVDPSASSFEGTMKRNTLFWLKVEKIYDWIRGSSKSVKSHSFRLMVWIVMFVCGPFFTFCFLFLFTALWPNERRHGQWSSVQPKRPKAEDIPSHPHDSSVMFSFIFVFDLYGGDTIDNIMHYLTEWDWLSGYRTPSHSKRYCWMPWHRRSLTTTRESKLYAFYPLLWFLIGWVWRLSIRVDPHLRYGCFSCAFKT